MDDDLGSCLNLWRDIGSKLRMVMGEEVWNLEGREKGVSVIYERRMNGS